MSSSRHTDRSSGQIPEIEEDAAVIPSELENSRLAEDRWRSLMDQSPFGVAIYRPDGKVIAGNATMRGIFGLTDAEYEAVLATYNILEDPQLATHGQAKYIRRAFSGQPTVLPCIEYKVETPIQGKKVNKWMEGVIFPILGSDGTLREVIAILVDVTPLITAQEELRVSRDDLRGSLAELEQLYTVTPVGLGLMDTELRFVRLNETLARINGAPLEDHLGKRLSEIIPEIARDVEPIYRRVVATGEPELNFEVHSTTPAQPGTERDWLVSYFPLKGADEQVRGVSTVVQEITELKRVEAALRESEARFREIAENIREVFWLFDVAEQKVVYVSPAFETVWGRTTKEILADYSVWEESVHPDDRFFAVESFALIHETGGGEAREYRIVRPNGEVRRISDRGFAIRDEKGQVLRIAGLAEDITARKEAEQERSRFEAKIQHAQKLESLGVLAGGIAHDFNNLLVGVLGNADLALSTLTPESPAHDLVNKIRLAAQRASTLTNQMLAYSGKGPSEIQVLDLNRLVQEMGHLLETVISKKVHLRLDLAPDLPSVEGDPSQIRQLVMNLITNASEAMGESAGLIQLRTALVDMDATALADCLLADELGPGRYVGLEVSDTGQGMDEEVRAKIFDPFFTTKFTGRGLGLAAVLGIVRGHGAGIRVESEVGKGSRITVLFRPSAAKPVEPRFEPVQSKCKAEATILVVDDEQMVREVCRKMLEQYGFKVMVAENGYEGVELFRKHADEIQLVLLDLTMPRLDGVEALGLMRQMRADVPVLVSSGYSEQDWTERFADEPAVGFIQKPYTSAKLVKEIREMLSD